MRLSGERKKEKNKVRSYGIEGWEEMGFGKQENEIKSVYCYSLPIGRPYASAIM
jgi:hypothetical protein